MTAVMNGQLFGLGPFRFRVLGPSVDHLTHTTGARWASIERLQRQPARQFIGAGQEQIVLDAVIYTRETEGYGQIQRMRAAAGHGIPYMLVAGHGRVFGRFVLESIDSDESYLLADGAPQKLEFSISLSSFGPDGNTSVGGSIGTSAGRLF